MEDRVKYLYKIYYNLLVIEGARSKMSSVANQTLGKTSTEALLLAKDIKQLHSCLATVMSMLKEYLETEDEDIIVENVQNYVLEDPYFDFINNLYSKYTDEENDKYEIN